MRLRNACIAALPFVLACACASMPDARMARTETGKFSYVLAGEGRPTIIFESGLGTRKETWAWILPDLSQTTRVFAYDRAGTGDSVARSNDRSGAQIVHELHDLLATLHLPPPYVLVGHSMGGEYISLYARTYPDEMAAAVYIDCRHEDLAGRCRKAGVSCEPSPVQAATKIFSASAREMAAEPDTVRQIHEAGPYPPIPVLVLTANDIRRGEKANRIWLELQKDLVALSPRGRQVVCDECGHAIHAEQPRMVRDEIRKLIAEVRQASR